MAAARDLDMVQQWRKTFRYAQPPIPGDRLDAMRFADLGQVRAAKLQLTHSLPAGQKNRQTEINGSQIYQQQP